LRTVDLHTHTTYSDGSLTPRELVGLAAKVGLAAVAITDHDTVDGIAEATAAGRDLGVEVLPGVEVGLECDGIALDLLAYFPGDAPGDEVRRTLAELRQYRDVRNAQILERLRDLGCPVEPDELATIAGYGAVGRPHIAEALRRKGYVSSIAEAFERFLSRGAPAWVDRRRLTLTEAVRLVDRADGITAIAHPGIMKTDAAGLARRVGEASRRGVCGLECYYPRHDDAMVERALELARANDLVPTGGSDFHGAAKPHVKLGQADGGRPVPYDLLDGLRRCWAARRAKPGGEASLEGIESLGGP
jgi:3',5'-nucleoside bisphosphate phosphatase